MAPHSTHLPFPALVGLDAARQALLLLAVEPGLGGVVLAAPAGSGKSSLARGFRALLGDDAPFVELPLGADEDGLLGGLDIQSTLRIGIRVARDGALARAHGGTVYVDGLNLLADSIANLLLGALDRGELRLEREGLSLRVPASFRLIGSYDPAEGAPRRHLLDRVGLLVVLPAAADERARAEVVRRNLGARKLGPGTRETRRSRASSKPPAPSPWPEWDEELEMLRGLVAAAREQLPDVRIADQQIEQLAAAALAFGVEGHRADMFAVLAARACAALALRDEVEHEDLEQAVRLVILPRATRMPASEEQAAPEDQQEQRQKPPEQRDPDQNDDQPDQPPSLEPQALEDQVLSALAVELPADLAELPFRALRRGRSGSRGTTSGKRGRHVRSSPGDPRRARIDVAATLRAAAPWQRLRAADQRPTTNDQNSSGTTSLSSLVVRPSSTKDRSSNGATSPSSLVVRPSSVRLRADDLRVKQFRSKAGALFLFAVDASGSMALHRMRQAKGAVHALLQQAYVHRDRVALMAFRGDGADLLLPPSQSVELARRALDLLPTGGGTPLAAALLRTIDIAKQARGRGILQTVLVLLTDGRANIGMRSAAGQGQSVDRDGIQAELQLLGRHVAEAGIQAIVVDTQRSYLSRGEARRLAEWTSGKYIYLPNAQGEQIAAMALDARDA